MVRDLTAHFSMRIYEGLLGQDVVFEHSEWTRCRYRWRRLELSELLAHGSLHHPHKAGAEYLIVEQGVDCDWISIVGLKL
jgi:hypothetical protein